MTATREHTKWRKGYLLSNAIAVVPLLLVFGVVFGRLQMGHDWDIWSTALGILFFVGCGIGFWRQCRRENRCTCLECGREIVDPIGKENLNSGDPINFYCSSCDIIWETGATVSDA